MQGITFGPGLGSRNHFSPTLRSRFR